jgi:hypothetical protein
MFYHRTRNATFLAATLLLSLTSQAEAPDAATRNDMALKPSSQNPFYWQYKGEPVVLLGGSVEDNLFQIPNLEAHLDLLKASGGNYIRNTLSSRDEGNVWMFHQREDGKYDLEKYNEAYYERLQKLLDLCLARDIIVQYELWDRFDYSRSQWHGNPFRPVNNINFTVASSGMKNEYPRHPGSNDNPFFRSIPKRDNNELILNYQRKHMDRVMAISLPYPNVIYCMDNETRANPDWGAYWSQYVKDKATALGVVVQTTEMWDDWNLRADEHRRTLDHPEIYSFVDTSQNNHQKGQAHWDNFQWVRAYLSKAPRPVNHVKCYGAGSNQFGDARDGVERFWRSLVGGAASIRFHRPTAGIGLGERAQANIKSARMFSDAYDLVAGAPMKRADVAGKLLLDIDDNEAHVNASKNRWAIYMPRGGEVGLVSQQFGDNVRVQWLDIEHSTWKKPVPLQGTNPRLKTPADGPWLALVEKR